MLEGFAEKVEVLRTSTNRELVDAMEEPFPPLAPEGGELSEEIRSYPLQLEREELLGALNFLNIEKPVQPQEAECEQAALLEAENLTRKPARILDLMA